MVIIRGLKTDVLAAAALQEKKSVVCSSAHLLHSRCEAGRSPERAIRSMQLRL